jgi:hypothetical protein
MYGDSGEGKTTQCYFMAKWLWEKFGLRTDYIWSGDGSVSVFYDSGLVKKGIVRIISLAGRDQPFNDIEVLSQGYWPLVTNEKPIEKSSKTKVQYVKEQIGMVVLDGIKGTCDSWLSHIARRIDLQFGTASEGGTGHSFKFREGEFTLGGTNKTHFGGIQNSLHRLIVDNFKRLPVKFFTATSTETQGEDEYTQTPLYGPASAGSAITKVVPTWFDDTFHLQEHTYKAKVEGEIKEVTKKVAWYQTHAHVMTGRPFIAKPRCLPEDIPKLHKQFPNGYVKLGYEKGIEQYFEFMEGLKKGKEGESGRSEDSNSIVG